MQQICHHYSWCPYILLEGLITIHPLWFRAIHLESSTAEFTPDKYFQGSVYLSGLPKSNLCNRWCAEFADCGWALQWRHNGRDCVSNHQSRHCLLNRLFRRRSKRTSKLRVTGLFARNSPVTDESPHKWPVTRKMFPCDDVFMAIKLPVFIRYGWVTAIVTKLE